jgi:hypothetical protein
MPDDLKPPIILFGNTRSGTSMVQNVVAAHPEVTGWYEPSEMWLYADPRRPHDEFDERDATDKVKRYIRDQFLKYQRKNGNCLILEKTPKNILKIRYVRAIFPEATYLFMVRNPFSFISSVEFKWQRTVTGKGILRRLKSAPPSQLHHHLRSYLNQQYHKRILKQKYLSIWGPRYKGIQEDLKTLDQLTVIARQWAVCSKKAEEDLALFEPGRVLRLRYEDFVADPPCELERICSHCKLELTEHVLTAAKELVKSDRGQKWRRFEPHDLARIIPEIEGEMRRHGYEIPAEIALELGLLQAA